MSTKGNTELQGESPVVVKYEPWRYNGDSMESVLIAHSYRKYVRTNPSGNHQVSGHGNTSKYAQWKLHAINNNKFKLQNAQTGKYLRIIKNGTTVDVGGGGGKFTVFKSIQHNPSTNNMLQPHMISLESVVFPGCFIAVNGECNVYSYNVNNNQGNKNDINLYLYARPQQLQANNNNNNINMDNMNLKPGIVVIRHEFGKHLRVNPQNEEFVNGEGGRGKFARWKLELCGSNLVKFKSTKSGKYLRIVKGGNVANVGGTGGQFTIFKYNPIEKTLESNKFPGHYLAMNQHNKGDVFAVFKNGKDNGDYFFKFNIISLPNRDNNNEREIVVIQHGFGRHLRVKPGNELQINGEGGRGKFARWTIEHYDNGQRVKFKSTKSGKYLRIIKNGSTVDVGGSGGQFTLFKYDKFNKTLESNRFPGYYLAVNQQNNSIISIQKQQQSMNISMTMSVITLNNQNEGGKGHGHKCHGRHGGKFDTKYNFAGMNNSMVVVRSLNSKSLRVKPGQLEISNCLGGQGKFARWNITSHGNNIYKLQSTHSNKYIRISPKGNGGEVDVRGTGGKYTQFRVHLIRDVNVVMFESVVFPNKYLSADNNGNVSVYNGFVNGNQQCMFEVFTQGNNYGINNNMNNNNMDQSSLIQSQQQLIESQKQFIDQLQRTVASQQNIINNLQQSQPGNNGGQSKGDSQDNIYPVLAPNNNNNNSSTFDNGENDDDFEFIPGGGKKN